MNIINNPSFWGINKSPASVNVDSFLSTNRLDLTTASLSNSRKNGTLTTAALMCTPADNHSPFSKGSAAQFVVQIISAPATASCATY